jgi:biotin transport system substrate-specific component
MEKVRYLVYAGLMAALTAVGALTAITIPALTPVPFTLQVLAVYLTLGLLPPRYAATAQLAYLALGALGLPVFAGGARGVGILVGPFAGYLWAYPVAAGIGSWLAHRPVRGSLVTGLLAALVLIYAGGVAGLVAGAHLSLGKAVLAGVVPFVAWDAVKAVVAYPVIRQVRRVVTARAAEA